jgi:hypothetical protein
VARRTWYDARIRLAFVSIIGPLFTPDEDKTCYDDDDTKNRDPDT